MKINVEVNLDWIDEEQTVDDAIKDQVIDRIVKTISSKIEKQVEDKITKKIDEASIGMINKRTSELFDEFVGGEVCITDGYGDKLETYKTLKDLMKKRFDTFLTQTVNDKGESYTGGYGNKTQRIKFIIQKQLEDFAEKFTNDAVKQVSTEIKAHVKDGLTTKLGAELMNVLKVDEMLKLKK